MSTSHIYTSVSTGSLGTMLHRKAMAYKLMGEELQRRAEDLVAIYRMVVEQVVYLEHPPGAPDGPQVYKRTYKLLNSITAEPVRVAGGGMGVLIYFDPTISTAWDGQGSYSIYVPLSTGFLRETRHWTSEWRKRAYDAVLELVRQVFIIAGLR